MVRGSISFWAIRPFSASRRVQFASVFASAFAALSCHSQNADKTGLLFKVAEDAHRKNLASISIPLPTVMPRGISSLDDELHSSFVVQAEPIAEVSTIAPSGDQVFSWYKLRLVQAFSHTKLGPGEPEASILSNDSNFPKQLLPIRKGDLIVRFVGGEIVIDGVKVVYGPEGAMLTPHRPYVFFLSPALHQDSVRSNTVFVPLGNLASVFKLDEDADTLTPLNPDRTSTVQSLVQKEYGNRMVNIKSRTPGVNP